MRIHSVSVTDFRGIVATSLADIGQLNVLIGKNNSGKSTVLDSLSGFLDMVHDGSPLKLDATLAADSNFRKGVAARSEVTVEFEITDNELGQIRTWIASEAPQMKHAFEEADIRPLLLIRAVARRAPGAHGFIQEISLRQPSQPNDSRRTLLRVSDESADELYQHTSEAKRYADNSRDFEKVAALDPADLLRAKDRFPGRTSLARYLPNGLGEEVYTEVMQILDTTTDPIAFRQQMEALTQSARNDSIAISGASLRVPVATFSGESSRIPGYALNILGLVGELTYLHLKDRREPVGQTEAQRLLDLKVRRGGTDVLRNLQETVQALMGVAIDAFEGDERGRNSRRFGIPVAEMDVDEVLVEMNGSGIREALRLVLDNELTKPDILLVEEPEVHLHPALEMSMLRYLQNASGRSQTFMTTHSTNFLDASDMRNVYLVSRAPHVEAVALDYESAQTALPANLGLRLSSLLMFDHLIFVEGTSDEAVLRELAGQLGLNLGRSGVGFVHMGGSRNFSYYAANSTLSTLTKRRMKLTFVLDRDEASAEELNKLKNRLGSDAVVHILERREMENYLAVPSALVKFIALKRRLDGSTNELELTIASVAQAMTEVATSLMDSSVERALVRDLCRPAYFDRSQLLDQTGGLDLEARVSLEVQRLTEDVRERSRTFSADLPARRAELERQWDGNEMRSAPGDELIDGVCVRFGVRYKKSRDSQRLASFVEVDDIAAELKALLRSVAQD